ncbi:MAG: TonB-dependent receptor [Bacteroidota bacterium]
MKRNPNLIKLIGLFTALLLFMGNAYAQETKVSGKVTDTNGEPLPGVTVVVKGTTIGTVTDMRGIYEIPVSVGQTLTYSYIGMQTQEVPVASRTELNVVLEESATDIDEVQVVAYGTQKKVTITGALSSIGSDELIKSPVASVANSLAGKVTGLTSVQVSGEPGEDEPELFIRGIGTFNDATPLYIVDGVERPFAQIDPSEIESITVLKDASATAVYGIRGANGVIIVSTKRGTDGKATISVSSSVGMQQPTRLNDMADSYTYAQMYNEAQTNDGFGEQDLFFRPHVIEAFRTGSDPLIFPNTDWVEYIMKPGAMQSRNNVSVRGGAERVKYFLSVGVLSQDGLFKTFEEDYDYNFSYNRYNYRSNIDIKATNTTDIGVSIGGYLGVKNEPVTQNGVNNLFRMINDAVPFSGSGIVDGQWIQGNGDYISFSGKEGLTPFYGRGYRNATTNSLNFDIDLKQDLGKMIKGLNFRFKFAYNTKYSHNKTRNTTKASYVPYYMAHLDPADALYRQYDMVPEDKTIVYRKSGEDGILSYGESKGRGRNWYVDYGFNYNRKIGNHNVGGLLLYNQRKTYYPNLDYKDIPTGVVGVVGRVTYDYSTKYLAEFNMGYNGSENFAPENRYGWFPAGSLGWIISEESFMQNIGFISYIKIRGSYGIVGNDKYSKSRFLYLGGPYRLSSGGYSFGTDNPANQPISLEMAIGNPDVTWETAHKQNIGIDTWFLNSRLAVNVDLFREYRNDILAIRQTLPGIMAFELTPVNIGEMENKGYEIELKWRDKRGDLRYWINSNVSFARNKVLYMDELTMPEPYMQITGHPVNTPFGYVFDGYFTEEDLDPDNYVPDHLIDPSPGDLKYKDLNNDSIVDVLDVRAIGYSRVPEYVFGLNMGAQYKGFDFSMSWAGATNVTRALGSVFKDAFGDQNNRSLFQYMADGRWTPETAETATYPRMTLVGDGHNSKTSDYWLKDASYLRLRNMEIGYSFKKGFLSKAGVKKMRIYVNGSNLLTFDYIKISDPEANASSAASYPLMKIYNFGLKADF